MLGLSAGSFLDSPCQLGVQLLFCVGPLKEGKTEADLINMLRDTKGGRDDHFLFQKNLRREVFCLCQGCVKSQASVGKGVHSAVSNNFRIKSGMKKHLSQLQSCDFMSSHPCFPLLYETPSQRSKQFLFSLIFTSQ